MGYPGMRRPDGAEAWGMKSADGAEACGMRSAERWKVKVLLMKCFRSLVGVSRMAIVRYEEVRRRPGIERELAISVD